MNYIKRIIKHREDTYELVDQAEDMREALNLLKQWRLMHPEESFYLSPVPEQVEENA